MKCSPFSDGTNRYIVFSAVALVCLSVSVCMTADVLARATGATSVTPGTDDFGPGTGTAATDPARGGVITMLAINATAQTNNWQGYYGNVGRYIVLADSTQKFMYSWNTTNQSLGSGSVIATRSASINWGALAVQGDCTVEDTVIPDAVNDKVNSTFANNTHTSIVIGNVTISASTCTTDLMVSNITNTTWEENMLTDGVNYVYQTFIHSGYNVFNGNEANFQMIVPEDEAGAAGTTSYYFWLELT